MATPKLKLISSDSHIMEPRDLWEGRIDPKFKDRAPRLLREGAFDQWYVEGVKIGAIGTNQQAGVRFEDPSKLTAAGSMDTAPLGGVDPHAHVKDMDLDSVIGGVLYASQGLHLYRAVPDSDLLSAIFRAYNDWMAEFCSPYPNRLKGIAMLNVDDVADAVGELKRVTKLGLAGAMIPVRPERRYDDPCYDPLWAAAQDLSIPLSLHVSTQRQRPGMEIVLPIPGDPVEALNRDADPRTSIGSLIFGGVFERFPQLKVGAVEFEVAWAPFFVRRMDIVYKERPSGLKGRRFANGALPSDIFRKNIFVSFQEDALGVELRSYIGVDNLMWGSDYPHAESTFPKSREIVDRILKGVPDEERTKIAGANAARLYNFN